MYWICTEHNNYNSIFIIASQITCEVIKTNASNFLIKIFNLFICRGEYMYNLNIIFFLVYYEKLITRLNIKLQFLMRQNMKLRNVFKMFLLWIIWKDNASSIEYFNVILNSKKKIHSLKLHDSSVISTADATIIFILGATLNIPTSFSIFP